MIQEKFKFELDLIDRHLRFCVSGISHGLPPQMATFDESMNYSLFSGGKRFRPLLSLLTAKALGRPQEHVLPVASAVELIHTYSLIHDDLPCMDNSDLRRGRPTHHKAYGEAMALLAGDGLLTMAFGVLAQSVSPRAAEAVTILSRAAGPVGMVGGQVLDLFGRNFSPDELELVHQLKTGRLISAAIEAAAAVCHASAEQYQQLKDFGARLGLAFQIADDLEDHNEEKPEAASFVTTYGVPETLRRLHATSAEAITALNQFSEAADDLRYLVQFNSDRV